MNPASGKQLVSSATFSFDSCAEQSHKDKSPDSQLLKPEAEDGIRDPDMSRGLGDVYKRQTMNSTKSSATDLHNTGYM